MAECSNEEETMRKKSNLSNVEQRSYDYHFKRLVAAGTIPDEEKSVSETPMLTVELIGCPSESVLLAPAIGGYGIAVWVRLVALKSEMGVCGCQVTPLAWDDNTIYLVDEVEDGSFYTTLGELEYPKAEVLNHRISGKCFLRRGRILEGVLLAQSFASPPTLRDGRTPIEVELCFFDQFDNQYPLRVDLMPIRLPKRIHSSRHNAGLYERLARCESLDGPYREKSDIAAQLGISPKEPNVPGAG